MEGFFVLFILAAFTIASNRLLYIFLIALYLRTYRKQHKMSISKEQSQEYGVQEGLAKISSHIVTNYKLEWYRKNW